MRRRRVVCATLARLRARPALAVAIAAGVCPAGLRRANDARAHGVDAVVGPTIAVVVLRGAAIASGREDGALTLREDAILAGLRAAFADPVLRRRPAGPRLAFDAGAAAIAGSVAIGVVSLDGNPAHFASIRAAVAHFHAPGRFVTLLGYEWTSWIHGHRHVIYFGAEGEVHSSLDPEVETPRQPLRRLLHQLLLTGRSYDPSPHPASSQFPVRLRARLDKLAEWYEFERRYTSQRNVYDRALAILARGAPENDLRRVRPLRGIARAFRLEAFYGVEGADTGGTFNGGASGAPVFNDGTQQRRGEAALTSALAIIDANSPVDQKMRGEVLTDLGDWYLVTNSLRRAYDSYSEAWKAFAAVDSTALISVPRILAYRPSISSVDRSQLNPEESVVKVVELRFTVDRDGRVDEVTSPTTDVPEAIVKNSMASMKRSRYAPRIENGMAVPTRDVVFYERVMIRVAAPDASTSSSGKAAESSAPKAEQPAAEPEKKPE